MKKRVIGMVMTFILSLSFGTAVLAAPESSPLDQDINGQGYISDDTDETQVMVDITVPASFLWYADKSTKNSDVYDIVSGTYQIINHSETVNLLVEILGYKQNAGINPANPVEEGDVTLNLTGDLAADGYGLDLFGSPSYGVYSELLASTNGVAEGVGRSTWIFGFNGSYNQNELPESPQLTDYVIELQFTASSISVV